VTGKGLDGKVALIVGGARGMGAEEARLLCDEGVSVMVADILDEQGEKLAASLPRAEYHHLDVSSESDWDAAVAETVARFGRLDVMVNNAGIYTGRRIVNVSLDEWNRMIAVNQTGVFLGMRAAGRAMIDCDNGGSIVNISSVAGLRGPWGGVSYVASKWAVRGMSRVAAKEFGPHGIRVNSIYPGFIQTDLLDQATTNMNRADMVSSIPLGRIGEASEVATVVLFLAGAESSYCSGQEFVVDGGHFG
jgi:3alpha(or 20beta)-hydroxysteroid dehydrogenase